MTGLELASLRHKMGLTQKEFGSIISVSAFIILTEEGKLQHQIRKDILTKLKIMLNENVWNTTSF